MIEKEDENFVLEMNLKKAISSLAHGIGYLMISEKGYAHHKELIDKVITFSKYLHDHLLHIENVEVQEEDDPHINVDHLIGETTFEL
jgi:hypothetical protein